MKMPGTQNTGRRLIFNDGTVIENGEAGYSDGTLWLWFAGYTMQDAAAIVFDPNKTCKIVFQYGEMEDEHTGFTSCHVLSIDSDGKITVCLVKG